MSIKAMITDLAQLQKEWEQSAKSPDLIDRGEWVMGIVYGIKLVIRLVQKHTHLSDLQRLASDLGDLLKNWQGKAKDHHYMDKTEWLRGAVYGINLASYLVNRHMSAPRTMRGQTNTFNKRGENV